MEVGRLVDFGACGACERFCFGLVGSFHPIVKILVNRGVVSPTPTLNVNSTLLSFLVIFFGGLKMYKSAIIVTYQVFFNHP